MGRDGTGHHGRRNKLLLHAIIGGKDEMITPFDHLVFASAQHNDHHVVYHNFLGLLKQTPMPICQFRPWDASEEQILPTEDAKLWSLGNNICVFAQPGIGPASTHTPLLVDAQSGLAGELLPHELRWSPTLLMLFKRTTFKSAQPPRCSFDVIPIMTNTTSADLVFPEIQLRFDATDTGWVWYMSPTGFVNSYLYEPITTQLPVASQKRLEDAVEQFGNEILYFLGAFDAHITKPGAWEKIPAKPARIKEKNGKVKKIYRIAQAGYQHYVLKE